LLLPRSASGLFFSLWQIDFLQALETQDLPGPTRELVRLRLQAVETSVEAAKENVVKAKVVKVPKRGSVR
jgi:hypothetical protein